MVIAGSAMTSATSCGSSAASKPGDVVELDDPGLIGDPRREATTLGDHPVALKDHQRRVALAVVLGVEHQHDLPAGQLPGEADHFGVRLGRRQRELPLRQPIAAGQVLGDCDRVLARQQELGAELHSTGDGIDDRARRVAAEGAHVGDVHVEVGVPVDVGEAEPSPWATQTGGWS